MSLNLYPVMTRAAFLLDIQPDPKKAGELFSDRMEVDSLFEGNEIHWS